MVWRFLKKLGIKPPYDLAIPLLGIYPAKIKIEKDICIPLFGEGNGNPLQYSSLKIPWTEEPGRLQSPSAVILEPRKIKSDTVFIVSPSISHEVMGPDAMILVF